MDGEILQKFCLCILCLWIAQILAKLYDSNHFLNLLWTQSLLCFQTNLVKTRDQIIFYLLIQKNVVLFRSQEIQIVQWWIFNSMSMKYWKSHLTSHSLQCHKIFPPPQEWEVWKPVSDIKGVGAVWKIKLHLCHCFKSIGSSL